MKIVRERKGLRTSSCSPSVLAEGDAKEMVWDGDKNTLTITIAGAAVYPLGSGLGIDQYEVILQEDDLLQIVKNIQIATGKGVKR